LSIVCRKPVDFQQKFNRSPFPVRSIKCYAYACPPCFTAPQLANYYDDNSFAYIHQDDCVPFLSINAGQRMLQTLQDIDAITSNMNQADFWATALDLKPVSLQLRTIIKDGSRCLQPAGADQERLCVPYSRILWLRTIPGHVDAYDCDFVNAVKLSNLSIFVDFPEMLLDHFPPRYEKAIVSIRKNLT
jgi:hypothetical protein